MSVFNYGSRLIRLAEHVFALLFSIYISISTLSISGVLVHIQVVIYNNVL